MPFYHPLIVAVGKSSTRDMRLHETLSFVDHFGKQESPMTCNVIRFKSTDKAHTLSLNQYNVKRGEACEKYDFMAFCISNHNNLYDYDPNNSLYTQSTSK